MTHADEVESRVVDLRKYSHSIEEWLEIFKAMRSGDYEHIEEIYKYANNWQWRDGDGNFLDHDRLQECVDDFVVRVWKALRPGGSFDFSKAYPLSWMKRVALSVQVDFLRSQRKEHHLSLPSEVEENLTPQEAALVNKLNEVSKSMSRDPEEDAIESVYAKQLAKAFVECMTHCTPRQRAAFTLAWDNFQWRETPGFAIIGEELGVSKNQAHRLFSEACLRLRQCHRLQQLWNQG